MNERIIPGYYAQAHEDLDPEKSVIDEVAGKTTEHEEKIRNILGRLLFTQDDVKKKISRLSGGELAKVALAELIIIPNNLLLLDEPTNHLDLASKEAVTGILKDYAGTVLVISHDRYVLTEVCNKIWEIKDGILTEYLGNYEDYRFRRKQLSIAGEQLITDNL
ncbi:MAG: ATP-binding cassette domain-containing protein [bacterium]